MKTERTDEQSVLPRRRYRIAMVAACPFPADHGTPGCIREMSVYLAELGHEIFLLTYPTGDETIPIGKIKVLRVKGKNSVESIKVGPTAEKPWLNIKLMYLLLKTIHKEKIDLIHAHNYEGALIGIVGKFFTGKPLVYHAINTMRDELPSYGFIKPQFLAVGLARLLDKFVPRFPDHIAALTGELKDTLVNEIKIPDRKVSIITAGVNLDFFDKPNPGRIRKELGLETKPVVMYTGVLDRFQRIDYLLHAFKNVLAKVNDAVLVIVHPQFSDPEEHQHLARELGVEANVIWAIQEQLDDLKDFLDAADVCVIPRPETPGFPIKLLNYMGMGKAIVTFRGSAKSLRDGVDGCVIEDHDVEGFGNAVIDLLQDPERAKRIAKTARESLEKDYSWSSICRKMETIYHDMCPAGKNL